MTTPIEFPNGQKGHRKPANHRPKAVVASRAANATRRTAPSAIHERGCSFFHVVETVVVGGVQALPAQVLAFVPGFERIIAVLPMWPDTKSAGSIRWSESVPDEAFLRQALLSLATSGAIQPVDGVSWTMITNQPPFASGHQEFA